MRERDVAERAREFCAREFSASVEVSTSTSVRAAYSSDASLYRVVPQIVAFPRTADDVAELISRADDVGLPVTARGAGTSCAGNTVGEGLVLDLRRLSTLGDVDPDARTVNVGPGVVQADLQRAAGLSGLRFGPDPSTASRCTVGGMLGNNACGPRAMGFGRAADVCVDLEFVDATGSVRRVSTSTWTELTSLTDAHLAAIRTECGRFPRQISGYSFEHLLPEYRRRDGLSMPSRDVAGFFVGTEGTLGIITEATVSLSPLPAHTVLAVAGFATMADAADAVMALLEFTPTACEGLDQRLVDVARARGRIVEGLPRGDGFLLVEFSGDDQAEVRARASRAMRALAATETQILEGAQAAALWRVRGEAAGLAALSFDRPAHAGWEDAAVPPERLGAYLRDFEALLTQHGLRALPYGHFGEGCVHARIDFPLADAAGSARYRAFVEDAADVVAGYGGSLSGEHGDGRARSELLARLHSPEILRLMADVKRLFDPQHLLNPGVLVDPQPLDADLRSDGPASLTLRHPATDIAGRCTGVGACVSHQPGTMCPSFRATGDETFSTRGRARVLQEAARGDLVEARLDAPEVSEVLSHCLACKACRTECPTQTDMAEIKSLALEARYRRRRRPRAHYSLGWLPRWIRLLRSIPGAASAANVVLRSPLSGFLRRLAGVDPTRTLPALAPASTTCEPGRGQPIAVWVDSFSWGFGRDHVDAVLLTLREAGFAPELVDARVCCGLTWITTGQRAEAARILRRSLELLRPYVERGMPIVATEPSCLAVWRTDAASLVDDAQLARLLPQLVSLGEVLAASEPTSTQLAGTTVVVQPHCHARSTGSSAPDRALLQATGADVVEVDGCCGMAGNFGMEPATVDLARAVAELELAPTLAAHPDAIVVAEGFSCRSQLLDMGVEALTLAQILAGPEVPARPGARTPDPHTP